MFRTISQLFLSNNTFFLKIENGCAESYEPVNDEVCVRISAYKETYSAAQAKCKSEGGYLLYVLEASVHVSVSLSLLIMNRF